MALPTSHAEWSDGRSENGHHVHDDHSLTHDRLRANRWDNLRLLSCGTSTFKYDLLSEDAEGNQDSTISVFTRDHDGTLRHVYSAHPWMAEDIKQRGIDLLSPVYNLLDLTPEGRDDWYAQLTYPVPV